jgi:hypothetical protein
MRAYTYDFFIPKNLKNRKVHPGKLFLTVRDLKYEYEKRNSFIDSVLHSSVYVLEGDVSNKTSGQHLILEKLCIAGEISKGKFVEKSSGEKLSKLDLILSED